ncbi:MAG TPA: hypothetical protein VHO06_04695 [Polyangia bacterium]|nr:hypothetical protein [Polyangia bacterium]
MPKTDAPPADPAPEARPHAGSLCWRCAHHRPVETARSIFIMCTALPVKYPRQPVSTCPAYRPAAQ